MKSVYANIDRWVVAQALLNATLQCVQPAGRLGRESGVFWLGTRGDTARVVAIAFPHGAGVEDHAGYWRVSPEVFGTTTRWAVTRGICLLGMVHTHLPGVPLKLSHTDRRCGVHAPGILEVIIGNGGNAADHRQWAWHVFENAEYHSIRGRELMHRIIVNKTDRYIGCTVNATSYEEWKEDYDLSSS